MPSFKFRSRRNVTVDEATESSASLNENVIDFEEDTKEEDLNGTTAIDTVTQSEAFQKTAELYRLLQEATEQHGAEIPIPVFVLVGMQSSGKSTVMNQLAKFPASYTMDGTATRCPTRFTMEQGPKNSPIVVYFEGQRLGSWHELHGKVASHMQRLDDERRFDPTPLNVRIVSPDVANFVVVDLPGLVRDDDKREQINAMVREALLEPIKYADGRLVDETAAIGKYNAIPIVVRTFVKKDLDDTFARIDTLIGGERPGWKEERTTTVVLNKMDERINHRDPEAFLSFIKDLREECAPVMNIAFTCLRPPTHASRIASMTPKEHHEYIRNLERIERQWIRSKFRTFLEETTDRHEKAQLVSILGNDCGYPVLDRNVTFCMNRIVDEAASTVQAALNQREVEFAMNLAKLNQALRHSSPSKLREKKEELVTKFLQYITLLRKEGRTKIADWCKIGYEEEFKRLRKRLMVESLDADFIKFLQDFILEPDDLRRLYEEENYPNERRDVDSKLAGVAKFDRGMVAWKAMVSCMVPNKLSWEQKRNMKGGHQDTLHGSFTAQMKNILMDMAERIQQAALYLAEMLRDHFHHMADCVERYISINELGDRRKEDGTAHEDDYTSVKLIKLIRDDYKKIIDRAIDKLVRAYVGDSKFVFVDLELPAFMMALAEKLQAAYAKRQLELEQFVSHSNGRVREPGLDIEVPLESRDADDDTLAEDEEKALRRQSMPQEPTATEDDGPNLLDDVVDIAGDVLDEALPFGVGKFISKVVKASTDKYTEVAVMFNDLSNYMKLKGKVRCVDVFNACMAKQITMNVFDNEDQASAYAALHLQIYQFVMIHNVQSRVHRLIKIVNRDDAEGVVSRTLRQGVQKADVKEACDVLLRSHDLDDDAMAEFEDFCNRHAMAGAKRMLTLSDDEVLQRFSRNDREELQGRRVQLIAEQDAFFENKSQILNKMKEAGLLDGEERVASERRPASESMDGRHFRNGRRAPSLSAVDADELSFR